MIAELESVVQTDSKGDAASKKKFYNIHAKDYKIGVHMCLLIAIWIDLTNDLDLNFFEISRSKTSKKHTPFKIDLVHQFLYYCNKILFVWLALRYEKCGWTEFWYLN